MTPPAGFARRLVVQTGVFGTSGHCGWLAADDPKEGEQGEYADSDREEV